MEQLIRRYGRRLIAFAVCLLLIGTESLTADGAETAADQTVKAGIFYFDGYHMKDEAGDLTGYGIEVLDRLDDDRQATAMVDRCKGARGRRRGEWGRGKKRKRGPPRLFIRKRAKG